MLGLGSLAFYLLLFVVVIDSVFLRSFEPNEPDKTERIPLDECSFKRREDDNKLSMEDDVIWDCGCSGKCRCLEKAIESIEKLEDDATLLNQSCCDFDDGQDNEDPFVFSDNLSDVLKHFWHNSNKIFSDRTTKQKENESAKVVKKTSPDNILNETRQKCCTDGCLGKISLEGIVAQRRRFWSKNFRERANYLETMIDQSEQGREPQGGGKGPSEKRMLFNGVRICVNAWSVTHGISRSSFFEHRQRILEGRSSRSDIPRARHRSQAYEMARLWFKQFTRFADSMPNSNVKCLPSCLTKLSVYNIYVEQMKGQKPLSRTQFIYDMWKMNFPNVYIPKQSRFTKCTICELLKEKLQNSRVSICERKDYTMMRKVHITQQMAEREKYYKHGLKAKQKPEKYLSLIIDGMDQSKHNLPHFNVTTKIDSTTAKLKTHVTGVLGNAHTTALTFIDCCQWPHDSNLTINILLKTLIFFQEKLGSLPPVLLIQMDNCYRECKNKYVLAFLSLLVKMEYFKKIKLSFLMVGHTHEDIDQMFSCFSRYLSKRDARTLPELMAEMRRAYTPEPTNITIDCMFDVKNWMDGFVENNISGHINQHQFKFVMSKGIAKTYYKKWSTSPKWLPKNGLSLVRRLPNATPQFVQPTSDKIPIRKLRQDIQKLEAKFDTTTENWWGKFLDDMERGKYMELTWYLKSLKKAKDLPVNLHAVTEEEQRMNAQIEKLMDKQLVETEIVVRGEGKAKGKRKRVVGEENIEGKTQQKKKRKV